MIPPRPKAPLSRRQGALSATATRTTTGALPTSIADAGSLKEIEEDF